MQESQFSPTLVRSSQRFQSYTDIGDVDLKEALLTLWRRKWTIVLATIVVGGLTAAVVFNMTPLYTGTVKILLEDQQTLLIPGIVGSTPGTEQVEVITSRIVAQRVIDKLELASDPEFNNTLKTESPMARWWRTVAETLWFQVARIVPTGIMDDPGVPETSEGETELSVPDAASADLESRLLKEQIVDTFLSRLTAETLQVSNVISISFMSERRNMAAGIVDEIANTYLEHRLDAKFEEIQRSTGWLNKRIGELRRQVADAETTLEAYRRKTGLVEADPGESQAAQQIAELTTQLILARTERAEREARRDQVQRLLRSDEAGLGSAVEVLNSPLVNSLIELEVGLRRQISDLSQEFGPRHPQLIASKADLADLQDKIRVETARVARSLQHEVNVAQERERILENGLRQLDATVADANEASIGLRSLEREASAARTLLETFMQQSQQLGSVDDLDFQQPDATVISYAAIPLYPSYPKKKLAVAAAIVVGGLLGAVLALLLERFEAVFRSAAQIEEELGLQVLGTVPSLAGNRKARRRGLAWYITNSPASAAAEAVRAINVRVLARRKAGKAVVVQVVSAEPDEGKSSVAISTAQMHARAGRRVLLIDADFRQSSVAKVLGLDATRGLSDLLAQAMVWTDLVQEDPISGAHVIASGRFFTDNHDHLASGRFADIIREVRDDYDVVIVDSPPALSLADAPLIATAVDGSLFVVRWARTRKQTVSYAMGQLEAGGGSIIGIVLTFVNLRQAARYSYGDSGQYSSKYRKYYLDQS